MGIVQINCDGSTEFAELNHHMLEEWQNNKKEEDVKNGRVEPIHAQAHPMAVPRGLQQQLQRPVVCWERFLPLKSLKVLLVESDESTRRVVYALLQNCGYEVNAVENGLQAWKILEDLTARIDLVLTEVVMPGLSGIGLICKIMNHETCKKIPVILMSSHDSMSVVFKCLSKGAVYFLEKPIRKNELQNLWQHVWRKCHSSSDSGSESGIMTQKSTKSRSAEESDNNSGNNDVDNVGSIDLNVRDGSDNGSGTQSSWTKRVVEVDSSKATLPGIQFADPPDSTCAKGFHSRAEAFGNRWVPMPATKEFKGQDVELENVEMGKDLKIGVRTDSNLQLGQPTESGHNTVASSDGEFFSELNSKKDDRRQEEKLLEPNNADLSQEDADFAGFVTSSTDSPVESVLDTPNGLFKISGMQEKPIYDNNQIPSLELSLKRPRDIGDTGTSQLDRNVLRHSKLHSAFSRYNSTSAAIQAPTGNVGSCSSLDNASDMAKTESIQNLQSNPSSTTLSQHSHGSSNESDVGLTINASSAKPTIFSDKPASKSKPKPTPQQALPVIQDKDDSAKAGTLFSQARGMNQQVQVQHHHHHYHHHHHHVHNMPQNKVANCDDYLLKKVAENDPHCGSSNVLSTLIEDNPGNRSLNGGTSGSNHESNGLNGTSSALNVERANVDSDNGLAVKVGPANDIGYMSPNGTNKNSSAQREAALSKFRQKRIQRCFEKKVRYQSRKKLAEQRPRVRGQFVRQEAPGNKSDSTVS